MGIPRLKIWNKSKNQYESVLAIKGKDGYTPQKGVDYWTYTDIQEMVDDVKSQITIPSLDGYATEQWVKDKKYLTQHQDLSAYALKEWVASEIAKQMKLIAPYTIEFGNGKLYAQHTSAAYSATSVYENGVVFTYRGASGVEEIIFPISGLSAGRTYTIAFDVTYNGGYIGDAYRFGCGVVNSATYNSTAYPTGKAIPTYLSWHTDKTGKQNGSFSFTADSDKAYWVWTLGRLNDGVNVSITLNGRVY